MRVSHVGAADGTTKQNDAANKDAAQYVPEKRVKPRRIIRPLTTLGRVYAIFFAAQPVGVSASRARACAVVGIV